MGKKADEIFQRLREIENSSSSRDEKINNILKLIQEFIDDFKTHDEREMAKYDKYDNHLQEVNKTLQQVSSGLLALQQNHSTQEDRLTSALKEMKTLETSTNRRFEILSSKVNKGIGAVLGVIMIVGVVAFVWKYMSAEIDKRDLENKTLLERVHKMENHQNRNYGFIQGKEAKDKE